LTAVSAQHLPTSLHYLESPLNHYGYAALAAFVFVEDFGVPVPGETILIAGAIYAGTGHFNVYLVGLIGFLAAATGDNVGFAIGRLGGRRLLDRFGRYVLLTPIRIDAASRWFERHGAKVVVIARFIEGFRQANGLLAGISTMQWKRFVVLNAIGAALWVAVWTSAGYLVGGHITSIYNTVSRYSEYVAGAIACFVVLLITRRVRQGKSGSAAAGRGSRPQPFDGR
jgi:membrane protein DedA with SNARE-associated domain